MNEMQALLLSLSRCWSDLIDAHKTIAQQGERIKELETQLKAVSKEA